MKPVAQGEETSLGASTIQTLGAIAPPKSVTFNDGLTEDQYFNEEDTVFPESLTGAPEQSLEETQEAVALFDDSSLQNSTRTDGTNNNIEKFGHDPELEDIFSTDSTITNQEQGVETKLQRDVTNRDSEDEGKKINVYFI